MMKISFFLFSLLPWLGLGLVDDDKQNVMETVLATVGREVASQHDSSKRILDVTTAYETTFVRRSTATATPFSAALITWAAGSASCYPLATTVTVSCATGGIISLVAQSGISKCTKSSASTYKCTKVATAATGSVTVKCTGNYKMTASLSSAKFSNCKSSVGSKNVAYQLINLEQGCAIKGTKNVTAVGSKVCTPASGVFVDSSSKIPFCTVRTVTCTKTSATACSMTTGALSVGSPSTFSSLCIL